MKITTYAVEGMSCMHCVHHVSAAIKEVKGVNDVKVSLENKSAVVNADESVSFNQLKTAVEEAGYHLSEK
ncbi:MAG: heavy metal-associated domain-containing protein [Erysipelotrichaceae bacterium]